MERTTHFAGVQPDPDLHANIVEPPPHRLLHPQRRVARPHRVILMCERRSEQRHDPVAHDLIHRAS